MKELSVLEMESIAGAYSWDFSSIGSAIQSVVNNGVEAVRSTVAMAAICASYGSMIGGSHGSDNGGMFGVGTVGMAIGGAWGVIVGAITGAAAGLMLGWEDSHKVVTEGYSGIINGSTGIY